MPKITPQHRYRDHNTQTQESWWRWIVMDNRSMFSYKLDYCVLVHRPMSTNKPQLRFCPTILDYAQVNCPVRLLHDRYYPNNWIPQNRESSVAKNAQHGVHCMHASDKTATWCYINVNAMRTVSYIGARQFGSLRPNNIICVIQCRAQWLFWCMKRRRANLKQVPSEHLGTFTIAQHSFSSQRSAQSYRVVCSGRLFRTDQSNRWQLDVHCG